MNTQTPKKPVWKLLIVLSLFYWAPIAQALVLHPAGEPNLLTWTDRPDPNVLGKWTDNASCVAISSNSIVTTKHQGGGISTEVTIAGITYLVSQIWNHSTADIRIARLFGANLTSFININQSISENGKIVVMGGYGRGRDDTPPDNNLDGIGYYWDDSASQIERWGQNKIESITAVGGTYPSAVITADFDAHGTNGPNGDQDYEATIAFSDSGGGWFIKNAGIWYLAGLSRGVGSPSGQAWYNPPEYIDAVQVRNYATWILQNLPQPWPGDLTGDDWVDFADFAVFATYYQRTDCQYPDYCAQADSEPDGDVDLDDLNVLAISWLTGP